MGSTKMCLGIIKNMDQAKGSQGKKKEALQEGPLAYLTSSTLEVCCTHWPKSDVLIIHVGYATQHNVS
jgi:hypothetical protein